VPSRHKHAPRPSLAAALPLGQLVTALLLGAISQQRSTVELADSDSGLDRLREAARSQRTLWR
jgi:hypothetical protein